MYRKDGVGLKRVVLLAAIGSLIFLGVLRPGCSGTPLETDLRRDLFLDSDRIEFVEGFLEPPQLYVLPTIPDPNQSRDQIPIVPFTRNCRLLWHVDARSGHFSTQFARLSQGGEEDATPCRLVVSVVGGDGHTSVEAEIPPMPLDRDANPNALREGPPGSLSLALPDGAETLEIQVVSSGDVPADSYVALLSPQVLHEPLRVNPADYPLSFESDVRLTAAWHPLGASEVAFCLARRLQPPEAPGAEPKLVEEVVSYRPVEVEGAFEGRVGRHALVFTGATEIEMQLDIASDSMLRGSVALDHRLPEGTLGRLLVLVGEEQVASLDVAGIDWVDVALPLGEFSGEDRRLSLRSEIVNFDPAPVLLDVANYTRGIEEPVEFLAQTVRFGFAEPRVSTPTSVPRRLATPQRPSVLVIQVETMRADVLDPFGGLEPGLTPNLQRLADRSVLYEQAIAPSPWTVPTTASLLTGVLPSAHGVIANNQRVIPDALPTLAERARSEGVVTAAFVTNTLLKSDAGYGRGFETYGFLPYRNAQQVNDQAEAFLENHAGQQVFLFLHYFDPHMPVDAPEEWRDRFVQDDLREQDALTAEQSLAARFFSGEVFGPDDPDVRFLRQRYLGEIAYFDEQLGRLLSAIDRMGLASTTAIIFTSDHGEEFMEHGLWGHGSNLHVETIHVPLMVTPAGALEGFASGVPSDMEAERVSGVVSTAGAHAEALQMLGVSFDPNEVLPDLEPRGYAFTETNKGLALDGKGDPLRRPLRAIRSETHMLLSRLPVEGEEGNGSLCFYDLVNDPAEQHPMTATGREADWHKGKLEEVAQWIEEHRVEAPSGAADGTSMDVLKELGYIGPGGGEESDCDG
jgi:arylsulfatase A-like enzyme